MNRFLSSSSSCLRRAFAFVAESDASTHASPAIGMSDPSEVRVVAERPTPGTPRPYDFPAVDRGRLSNGLSLAIVHLPGRPLVSASLVLRNGAADEPDVAVEQHKYSAHGMTLRRIELSAA